MIISASFLSKDKKPSDLIKFFDKTNVDFIHVDVMDGKFVNEKSFTISEIEKLSKLTSKKLDIHLMVSSPKKYIERLSMLNVEYITIHLESVKNISEYINIIKNYGIKVGVSIKPNTSIHELFPYLPSIDLALIMSVEPGKSGQIFMNSVLYKIEVLKKMIDEKRYKCLISVDGGINDETVLFVKEKGADMIVSASFIQNNPENIELLKKI